MAETQTVIGGQFLTTSVRPGDVFIREELTDEQRLFGQTAAEFMRNEVLPNESRLFAHDWAFVRTLMRKAADLDLLRLEIPEAYGGLGLSKISAAYVGEQIAASPSFAGSIGAHTSIGTLPTVYFGNEAQKAKYLPQLASGTMLGAYALTEPQSGSDALAAKTTAVLSADGRHYLLNGQKMWITNGGFADLFTVFAKVDGEKFTAFLVERSMGIKSGPDEKKLGLDGSSTTALMLDNVPVPVENVLGTIGEGHKVAFNILNIGRVKLGTRNISGARLALANATRYAKERRQFGRAIAEFGLIQQKLAEMSLRCYIGDAMVYRALGDADRALDAVDPADAPAVLKAIEQFAIECSINKVFTSETLAFVVDEALQVFGGNGYSREFPAERAYRDARITRIYEGTNEINRMIVATRLLKQGLGSAPAERPHDGVLAADYALAGRAKRLALGLLNDASAAFGAAVKEQQELLAHISNIVIEIYAIESGLARTEKIVASGAALAPVATDAVRVFASDASDRMVHAAKQVARALAGRGRSNLADLIAPLAAHPGVDSVAARRRIAEPVIAAGRHPF